MCALNCLAFCYFLLLSVLHWLHFLGFVENYNGVISWLMYLILLLVLGAHLLNGFLTILISALLSALALSFALSPSLTLYLTKAPSETLENAL